MKRTRKITALLLALSLIVTALAACQAQAQPEPTLPAPLPLTDTQKEEIADRYAYYLNASGVSGAAYAVCRGEVLFDGGAGNAAKDIENSTQVAYGIASLTKQFTAAAILQLYEAGKLDLSDKLSKYFPDYDHGDRITLHQLLSMRSGVPDYEVYDIEGEIRIVCAGTPDEYAIISPDNTADENIRIIRDYVFTQDLLFTPGERFDYSDSNFALLAGIIAMVSGEDYHSYLRKHLFEPAGLENAAFIGDGEIAATVAEGDDEEFGMDYYQIKGAEYGCGEIITTPRDLYRWYKALFGGEIVSSESLALMTTNYSAPDEGGYGCGLMLIDKGAYKVAYHYGMIPSFYSAVFYIPDADFFLTVLSNREQGYPQSVAGGMISYFAETAGIDIFGT